MFSGLAAANDYDGAWYSDADDYDTPAATYTSKHQSSAIYDSSQDKTYFVYMGKYFDPYIGYYDHTTDNFSNPVKVADGPINDAHAAPSLLIDNEGYLYVFYGSHNTNTDVKRSTNTYDITSWTVCADVAGSTTYPQVWELSDDTITVLYRENPGERYLGLRTSTDNAATWSVVTKIIEFTDTDTSPYFVSTVGEESPTKKLHIAWDVHDWSSNTRTDIYYAYSDDGGSTFKDINGSSLTLPINEAGQSSAFVFDTDPYDYCKLSDIKLDENGKPLILFACGNKAGNTFYVKLARWSGTAWVVEDITTVDHYFDSGSIFVYGSSDYQVYFPSLASQTNEDGGDVQAFRSVDGGDTWGLYKNITAGSTYSHNYVKSVHNAKSDGSFDVFWSYGDSIGDGTQTDYTKSVSLLYYGDSMDTMYVITNTPVSEPEATGVFSVDGVNYTHRRPIYINNTGGSSLNGVEINYTSNYAPSMKTNLDDCRYYYSNNTSIPYAVETIRQVSSAFIWLNVSVPADTNLTIYEYYGNPALSTASNPENTFRWWYGADNDTETTNKFDVAQGSISVIDGKLELIGTTGTRGLLQSKIGFSYPIIYEVYAQRDNNDWQANHFLATRKLNDWSDKIDVIASTENNINFQVRKSSSTTEDDGLTVTSPDSLSVYGVSWNSSNAKLYQNYNILSNLVTNVPTSNQYPIFYEGSTSSANANVDWARVRSYLSSVPGVSVGPIEAATCGESGQSKIDIYIKQNGNPLTSVVANDEDNTGGFMSEYGRRSLTPDTNQNKIYPISITGSSIGDGFILELTADGASVTSVPLTINNLISSRNYDIYLDGQFVERIGEVSSYTYTFTSFSTHTLKVEYVTGSTDEGGDSSASSGAIGDTNPAGEIIITHEEFATLTVEEIANMDLPDEQKEELMRIISINSNWWKLLLGISLLGIVREGSRKGGNNAIIILCILLIAASAYKLGFAA